MAVVHPVEKEEAEEATVGRLASHRVVHPAVVVAAEVGVNIVTGWIKMDYMVKWICWPKTHVIGPTGVASATSQTLIR